MVGGGEEERKQVMGSPGGLISHMASSVAPPESETD